MQKSKRSVTENPFVTRQNLQPRDPMPVALDSIRRSRATQSAGSREDAGCAARSGQESSEPSTSSAIQCPPEHPLRSPQALGWLRPEDGTSDQGGIVTLPCPIMGKILPMRQQVEVFPSETHCPKPSLGYEGMRRTAQKAVEIQEHESIGALRGNVRDLMDLTKLSYKAWAKRNHVRESLGRTLNGLVLGDRHPRIDVLADASDALHIRLWQLFVPGIAALTPHEQKELHTFVARYVASEPGVRNQVRAILEKLDHL